jgi:asparagine synthase (glutamine-hydrolysing)
MLALAVDVARREGLPLPIPATLCFADIGSAEESAWQRRVIDHLGLRQWERIEVGEELDLLGEVARAALRSHGLLWPPNAYLHVPIIDLAAGGSLVTGVDGDGLFGGWQWWRAQAVLGRRVRPQARDLLRVGLALSPPWLRRYRPAQGPDWGGLAPWLRPAARGRLAKLMRDLAAAQPRRWDAWLASYARQRHHRLGATSLAVLAAPHGVTVVHPLLAPEVLAALAEHRGALGYPNRTAAMGDLFGDLLPAAVIERSSKAEFGAAVWRSRARAFARSWDGSGVPDELVDPTQLRAAWSAPNPLFGSMTLLHLAWLASEAARAR